jgi:hypothetical protein
MVEDPKDLRGALDEAMNHRGPALVNVRISDYGNSLLDGSVRGFSLDILDPDAAPLAQALPRLFDAAQKARIIFELIIEPIILGREADQQSGRFPVAGDDDLLSFGFAQKPREVVLDFG